MRTENATEITARHYFIERGYTPSGKLRWIIFRDGFYYGSGTTERQAQNLMARFIAEEDAR